MIVGFKCGCVLSVRTDDYRSSKIQPVFFHKHAVYDVLTFAELPTCFLTLSHDQNVVFFDTRQPFGLSTSRSTCSQHCSYPNGPHAVKPSGRSAGFARLQFQFPVTAGDVHPLDGARRVAVGCADGFVRLFDLRRLTKSGPSPSGEENQPMPFLLIRPLGLPAKLSNDHAVRLDYGPAHITSIQFEPIYPTVNSRLAFGNRRINDYSRSGFGGRRILVSHMYAPVFLFDTTQTESSEEPDAQTVEWLPESRSAEEGAPPESESAPNGTSGAPRSRTDFDPAIQIALAFFCWIERQRTRRQATGDEQPGTVTSRAGDASDEEERVEHGDTNPDDESETSGTGSRTPPFDLLTDEYVAKVLGSTPRALQVGEYRGRRSCRTVIKSAAFWGRDHILSGSECGHVIAWDRWTGKPLNSIKADESVVNRISPHPTLPMFASSGIDRTVKIIEPDPRVYETDEFLSDRYQQFVDRRADETSQLCEQNVRRMVDSLQAGSLHLERLARLSTGRALRNILRRLVNTNRPSDSGPSEDRSTH